MRATQGRIEPVGGDVVAHPEDGSHRGGAAGPAPGPADDFGGAA